MATYLCHCREAADVLLREYGDDGRPVPLGKSWAVCVRHVGQVMPQFVGMTVRVAPVSRTWAEHVARRTREGSPPGAAPVTGGR